MATQDTVVPLADALLTATTGVSVISEDFRKPERVLVRTGRTLDLSRPVALILAEVAHFIPDSGEPGELVRRYVDPLPPGSHLVLTHFRHLERIVEINPLTTY
ncbi:MAG: SAM-dependent methyltransferase [Trebonia sp.]